MISSLTRSTRWSAQQKPQSALSRRELSFATQVLELNRCSPSDAGVTPPLRLGDAATDFGARNGGRSATSPKRDRDAEVIAMSQNKINLIMFLIPFAGTFTSRYPLPEQLAAMLCRSSAIGFRRRRRADPAAFLHMAPPKVRPTRLR